MTGRTKGVVLVSLAILLLSIGSTGLVHATTQGTAQKLVPTTICACQPAAGSASVPPEFKGPPQPPSTSKAYDEQLGITFTQSFTSLEYNVTAVEQTDPNLGTGPGYLLNGLSNTGYWYQVGLSWNWDPGQTPGTGFAMSYEVFDPAQNSIFPANGGGGLQSISGTVNQGDTVALNLYFTTPNQVVMLVKDLDTGASSSETFSAEAGTVFVGSPNSVSNANGFFTGLMNEWYHGDPFYANGKQVIFSDTRSALSSAWMWMDEFNANTLRTLFSSTTGSPVTYNTPDSLQKFSFNGTVEYSDAYEFITGNATSTVTNSTVPLTLSYSVLAGGTGYQAPVLTYVSDGAKTSATLTSTATAYKVDIGSIWTLSKVLNGSSSSERWQTDQNTTGVARAAETISVEYVHQFSVDFEFGVSGGGSGYSPPAVTYVAFGSEQTAPIGSLTLVTWVDAASRYNYTDPLVGSASGDRWNANPASGAISSSGAASVTYYHQYLAIVMASFKGSEIFPSVSIRSVSSGASFDGTIVQGMNSFWLDANAQYSISQTVSLLQGERWATNATTAGLVSAQLSVPLAYEYQYFVVSGANVPSGGTVSSASGWYLPGTSLQVTATPNSGWKFEGWTGKGSGSVSGANSSLSLMVSGPANETATFYPGVSLTATGPISVSYQDGSISGAVPSGISSVVYVPPSSTISLSASSAPFLYSFTGWSGASTSRAPSISLFVNGPESATANSSYNDSDIALIVALVAVVVPGAAIAIRHARRQKFTIQKETVGSPVA